jgi:hypothetical protein
MEIYAELKRLERAYWAADDRHVYDEQLWCQWQDALAAELTMPVETPADACGKLWWACYCLDLAHEDVRPLARRLSRVANAIKRGGAKLRHVIELRTCMADCALLTFDTIMAPGIMSGREQATLRIAAVIDWLACPRLVPPKRRHDAS